MAHRIVGQPIGRLDGIEKVSGAARYSGDVTLPGIVWGKALRSPLPHARILRIDTSRAQALPGVLAVLTAQDLPDILVGRRMFDMPMLARDRVRFVGEKVAVVAAVDPDIAEEALALIDVEYEDLPAVIDPVEAIQVGAPVLHENPGRVRGSPARAPAPERPVRASLQAGGRGGRVPRGRSDLRAHLPHAARPPGLSRASRRASWRSTPTAGSRCGRRTRCPSASRSCLSHALRLPPGADPRQPDADRRRLRRQGLVDGSAARLPPGARDGAAGQDGHALRRGADGGQPAPPLRHHDAHRRDEGRADRRAAGEGALQQRRLRRLQAGAERESGRRRAWAPASTGSRIS